MKISNQIQYLFQLQVLFFANTQAQTIKTLDIKWNDIIERRNPNSNAIQTPGVITPLNKTSEKMVPLDRYKVFLNQYETNSRMVPFNTVRSKKLWQRDGSGAYIDPQLKFSEDYVSFKIRIYTTDRLCYIPEGKTIREIRRAKYVRFNHPKRDGRTKKIYFIPQSSQILVIPRGARIFVSKVNEQTFQQTDLPNNTELYSIKNGEPVANAQKAKKTSSQDNTTHSYSVQNDEAAFYVSCYEPKDGTKFEKPPLF